MVVYKLICSEQHEFEGWFASSGDYDRQRKNRQIACPICESEEINRLPSAPYVNVGKDKPSGLPPEEPSRGMAREIRRLVEHLYRISDDVGSDFPEEARKIHYQEVAPRNIRGTATRAEVEELKEEGIEVFALPQRLDPRKLH